MTMKPINDIRLFTSSVPNADSQPLPGEADSKHAAILLRRIAMKLREANFSLGSFDHLYINLTPCIPEGAVQPSARSVHRETAWLRYADYGVTETQLADPAAIEALAPLAAERCLLHFAPDSAPLVRSAIRDALHQGARMRMRFREKHAAGLVAVIYLQLLDNGLYHPLVCVTDEAGNSLLSEALPPCLTLDALGEIRLTKQTVTILPRRNAFTAGMEPVFFRWHR